VEVVGNMNSKQFAASKNTECAEVMTLTQIMHYHAEQSISDEQIERVVKPVIDLIYAGHFDSLYETAKKPSNRWKSLWARKKAEKYRSI